MDILVGQIKKSWKFLVILAILAGLFGAYPYVVARVVAGESWRGVVPEFQGDNLYYMIRANRAIHGEIAGNPYYATTYDAPSLSFSVADSITGMPYAFFAPFGAAIFNSFLWNALFASLLGGLLLCWGYSRSAVTVSVFFVASSIFSHMLRATNMQTIFPLFLLFFILLLVTWARDRLSEGGGYSSLFLGCFAGVAPYLHTFLFQIIAASLFVGLALSLLLRRTHLSRSLITSIAVMALLATPYFLYIKELADFPVFAETMNIFGAVRSHFPPLGVYFYGRWAILLFAWSFLLWATKESDIFLFSGTQKQRERNPAVVQGFTREFSLDDVVLTMGSVSLGTLAVMMANIVTGVDLYGPGHANYFIQLLLPLGFVLLIPQTIRVLLKKGVYIQKIFLLFCSILVLLKVVATLPAQFPQYSSYNSDSTGPQFVKPAGNPQYIMPALVALRSLRGVHVVVAPHPLSSYIPLYTEQRVLYDIAGGLFSVGAIENTERFFVSRLGESLTEDSVGEEYHDAGDGAYSDVSARNRFAQKLCSAILHSSSCDTLIVARVYNEDGVIDRSRWFSYYQATLRPNVLKYLHRFDVSEVVIDRRLPIPEFLRTQAPWYSDRYYAIYNITELAP